MTTTDWHASYHGPEGEHTYVEGRAQEIAKHLRTLPDSERGQAYAGALWFSSAHCRDAITARVDELMGGDVPIVPDDDVIPDRFEIRKGRIWRGEQLYDLYDRVADRVVMNDRTIIEAERVARVANGDDTDDGECAETGRILRQAPRD